MSHVPPDAKAIFLEAIEKESTEGLVAYLDAACQEDSNLRMRVEKLIQAHGMAGKFLGGSPSNIETLDPPRAEVIGTRIGPYKLMEEIGQGGMGVVYMAEQKEPVRRRVALKIVKPGMDSRQVLARFDAERQVLAIMDHPSIARIIDAGTTELGRPYFVMELVQGIPINEFCDQKNLTVQERLKLFLQVCQAVQHAHQKGIIHRDLKPSNVLVTQFDVVNVPKVIDFGIAKAFGPQFTDYTQVTGFAQFVGTPLYMSPEQAEMNQLGVDTRSDVYSLGVMLYELLTGKTPFESETLRQAGLDEIRRIIREVDPPQPSARISTLAAEALSTVSKRRQVDPRKLSQQLRGELDWIVMKAMEKDRNRRYETANAMADDIQRYLDDLPVQASPPSYRYRVRKFARRNRVVVLASGSLLLMMVMATVVSAYFGWKASVALVDSEQAKQAAISLRLIAEDRQRESQRLEKEATASRDDTQRTLYLSDMRMADAGLREANTALVHKMLERHIPAANTGDNRGWEWYYLLGASNQHTSDLAGYRRQVDDARWSHDGKWIATTGPEGVRICDAATGKLVYENFMGIRAGAWSPDSQRYAWGSASPDCLIRIWDSVTNQVVSLEGHSDSLTQVAWSPDGQRLVSTSYDATCRIWDYPRRASVFVIQDVDAGDVCWNSKRDVIAAAGKGRGWIIDAMTGKILNKTPSSKSVSCIEFTSDGQRLLVGYAEGRCSVHDADRWKMLFEFQAHSGAITDIDANPVFPTFATCGADGMIHAWQLADGKKSLTLYGHQSKVNSVDWDPSGEKLVTAGMAGQVKTWEVSKSPVSHEVSLGSEKACALAWDANSSRLVCAADDGSELLIDLSTKQFHKTTASRWSIDDEQTFTPSAISRYFEDSVGSKPMKSQQWFRASKERGFVWSADGSKVASLERLEDGKHRISAWTARDPSDLHAWTVQACVDVEWAPDNRRLAIAGLGQGGGVQDYSGLVYVVDTTTGGTHQKLQNRLTPERDTAVAWDPSGTMIVSGNIAGLACIFEARQGRRMKEQFVSKTRIESLAWSPDGQRIASADNQGQVKILQAGTLEELLTLRDGPGGVTQLAWSPDGQQLAGIRSDSHVVVWNASPGFVYANSESFRKETRKENTSDLVVQANASYSRNDYESVIALLDQPFVDEEDHTDALFLRGMSFLQTNRLPSAVADLKRVTEMRPNHQFAWNWLGIAQTRLGQYDEAISSLTASYEAAPQTGQDPLANRAMAYLNKGDVATAQAELQQICEKDPLASASHKLAMLYLSHGQTEAYQKLCKRMLDHIRQNEKNFYVSEVDACWTSALSPIALDDQERLLSTAKRFQQQLPDSQQLNLNLGAALYRAGKLEQALDPLLIACKEEDRTRTPDRGRYTESDLRKRIVYAHYLLALTQGGLNQRELGLKTLEQADALAVQLEEHGVQSPWKLIPLWKLLKTEAAQVLFAE